MNPRRIDIASPLAALIIPTFASLLGGCDGVSLACATFDGRLASFPGISLAAAQERCGRTFDSYAYLADKDTLIVALEPSTQDQDLHRALEDVDVELTLPADLQVGQVFELPRGRLAERGADGIARVTAVATAGQIVVDEVTWEEGLPHTVTLTWDLTFGTAASETSWLTVSGADTLDVSRAFCEGGC